MSRTWLLSLAAVIGVASSADAQVVVRAPFVTVQTSPVTGVAVQAPFVRVQTPPPVVVVPPPVEVTPAPRIEYVPPPPPPVVATRPPTLAEFAATFKPLPGTYDAVVLHPVTKKPVHFTFTLPPGGPCKVRVWPKQITFIYGNRTEVVSVRFLHDGRVRVTN